MVQEIDYSVLLMRSKRDQESLRILQALGLKCYMCVPIRALDKLLGVFTFVSAESGRRYGLGDPATCDLPKTWPTLRPSPSRTPGSTAN
jgi:hypothetical protein